MGRRFLFAVSLLGGALISIWPVASAHAEALRCSAGSVAEGDSRLSVAYKCGEPLARDSFCAPVIDASSGQPLPQPYASLAFPCQPIDEWLYDRGPGNLMATVRFRSGVVQSITYGRSPR